MYPGLFRYIPILILYTNAVKIGFWLPRIATAFELVCIAQQLQVVLLRRRLLLAQMPRLFINICVYN